MTLPITPEQAKALMGILESEQLGFSGVTGRHAREIVALIERLPDTDGGPYSLDISEAHKNFLRGLDAKAQRPLSVERIIGPFFDLVRS